MPHSSESDPDAPETISLKMAKKSSKAEDKLVQDRNSKVATLAKEKNRARDARLKAAKEAANNRSNNRTFKSDPSLEENGGKTQKRSLGKSVTLPEDDNGIDVEPNREEDDPTQMRMRARMEAAMHDAEDEGTEELEGLSDGDGDGDGDAEGLDGDFAFGEDDSITYEDGELEEISVDDEDMKVPEDEDDKDYQSGIGPVRKRKEEEGSLSSEYGITLGTVDYLPDELFDQAAAAITARVQKPTDSKTKEVKRRKRSRRKVKSKDLIIGSRTVQVVKPLNPAAMAPFTVPSKSAQRFVKRRLKGGSATTDWERRPVNVGSLSVRGGPAKCFRRT